MLDKIITYFKDNPTLFYACALALFIIVVAVVVLIAKKANAGKQKVKKSKKVKKTSSAPVQTPYVVDNTKNEPETTEPAPEPVEEQPVEKAEEKKEEPAKKAEEKVADKAEENTAEKAETVEKTEVKSETKAEEKAEETPVQPVKEEKKTTENTKKADEKPVKTAEKPTKTAEKTVKTAEKAPKKQEKSEKTTEKTVKKEEKQPENTAVSTEENKKSGTRYNGKWVVFRLVSEDDVDGTEETFFFELRASNGERLLSSEEYTTYQGAIAGIETHKSNIEKGNFRITLSKKGDYLFKLMSGKNMLLCMGDHYATKTRCESAIESAKRFAKTAILDEEIHDVVLPAPEKDDEEEIATTIPDGSYVGKWVIRANRADGDEVFYFDLLASNGEKLLSSEEYTSYAGAINGITTHKTNIEKGNFRVSFTKHGDYIFKLLNGNGQLLCLGEHYKSKPRCESAIESVKRFARSAPILADESVEKK